MDGETGREEAQEDTVGFYKKAAERAKEETTASSARRKGTRVSLLVLGCWFLVLKSTARSPSAPYRVRALPWRDAVPGVRILGNGAFGEHALGHGDFIEIALPKSPSIQTTKNNARRTRNQERNTNQQPPKLSSCARCASHAGAHARN
jgi:hypothetical protein